MKIITTITINISEENLSLIPFIVTKNGGLFEGETNEDAIIRLRNEASFINTVGQIVPHVITYFGEANKDQVDAITNSLYNGAITTSTIIEDGQS